MDYEELVLAGIKTEELLDWFQNNGRLIKLVISKFLTDTTCRQLEEAVAKGDLEKAAFACHTLKGICGNMALTQLYHLLQEQLRLFRAGEGDAAAALTPEILARYEKAVNYAALWLSRQ